ncbi:BTB-POZ and MATH domain 4 [Striga asiatica]|uniref:BTB-POZ and MATH domain 4 n=1 Tax=Striga asiatica TaxID=4170 RepID=A0A5A7RJ39_STRAF|nr:BTB-POZ and MATH domain 4 [Striga asiatica]
MEEEVGKLHKSSYVWVLKDYSRHKARLGAGQAVESPEFTAGGHRWAILFYPNGFDPDARSQGYASMYLSLRSVGAGAGGNGNGNGVQLLYYWNRVDMVIGRSNLSVRAEPTQTSPLTMGLELAYGFDQFGSCTILYSLYILNRLFRFRTGTRSRGSIVLPRGSESLLVPLTCWRRPDRSILEARRSRFLRSSQSPHSHTDLAIADARWKMSRFVEA